MRFDVHSGSLCTEMLQSARCEGCEGPRQRPSGPGEPEPLSREGSQRVPQGWMLVAFPHPASHSKPQHDLLFN